MINGQILQKLPPGIIKRTVVKNSILLALPMVVMAVKEKKSELKKAHLLSWSVQLAAAVAKPLASKPSSIQKAAPDSSIDELNSTIKACKRSFCTGLNRPVTKEIFIHEERSLQ